MAITVQNVRDFDRAFADTTRYPDALISTYIGMFFNFIDAGALPLAALPGQTYGTRDLANLLFTCARLTMAADGAAGKSGSVTREKVGDVEVQYAATKPEDPGGNWGSYGMMLADLIQPFFPQAVAVG